MMARLPVDEEVRTVMGRKHRHHHGGESDTAARLDRGTRLPAGADVARARIGRAVWVELLEKRELLAKFAVIGDFTSGTPLRDVSNQIKSWNPAYVVTVGD